MTFKRVRFAPDTSFETAGAVFELSDTSTYVRGASRAVKRQRKAAIARWHAVYDFVAPQSPPLPPQHPELLTDFIPRDGDARPTMSLCGETVHRSEMAACRVQKNGDRHHAATINIDSESAVEESFLKFSTCGISSWRHPKQCLT